MKDKLHPFDDVIFSITQRQYLFKSQKSVPKQDVSVDKREEEEELLMFLQEEKKAIASIEKNPLQDPISDIITTKAKG